MQGNQQQNGQIHLFLNNKQTPQKRVNISIVDMNKSKIKFLNKYQSKSDLGSYNPEQVTPRESSNPVEQYSLQFRMKQKFEELYKRILRISGHEDMFKGRVEKRFLMGPNEQIAVKKSQTKHVERIHNQLLKLGYRSRSRPTKNYKDQDEKQKDKEQRELINFNLQINTSESDMHQQQAIHIVGNTRYKPRLVSLMKPKKMSNNIKDYLSVQKIRIKDLQDSIIEKHHNIVQKNKANRMRASLYNDLSESLSNQLVSTMLPVIVSSEKSAELKSNPMITAKYFPKGRNKKFEPPFQTYYYRDLLWRVSYSNQKILQFPAQYQSKIRVFIGKGNNSRLVKSIINRRSWYQITQKIEQAHFVWTQIKVMSVFTTQPKTYSKLEPSKLRRYEKGQPYLSYSIWTNFEDKYFKKYFISYRNAESRMPENMKFRNKTVDKIWAKQSSTESQKKQPRNHLQSTSCSMPTIGSTQPNQNSMSTTFFSNVPRIKIQNHLVNSYLVGNKKALFQTMTEYYTKIGDDVFKYLPLTFHISQGLEDEKYLKFLNHYYAIAKKTTNQDDKNSKYNAWIVKPGQNTNRGQGITVCLTLDSIKNILKKKDKHNDGSYKTYIVQKYIEKPMLYKKRKFDLRHYIMVNCSNGYFKGYWFRQGYVRTTSSEYTLKQGFGSVHLTNDAVQKNLPDYGRFQKGNKISYDQLEAYLGKINNRQSFWEQAYPQMKKIAIDVIRACAPNLDTQRRTNFQIFGLDFMIDDSMQVWLIQVNTNPCLELSCPLLAKIIPKMIENTLEICLDPHYPPPLQFNPKGMTFKKNCLQQMQYQLVYDQRFQTNNVDRDILNDQSLKKDEDDCFEDDGQDWNQD